MRWLSLFFEFLHGISISRINWWMKNGELTDSWNLNKREKAATFELGLAECLSQILAVSVKVDEASIYIN